MPLCCNQIFTGWACPICGLPISFIEHGGSSPVSIGGISTKNVTINQQLIQGDYIEAGAVKGSLTKNYMDVTGTEINQGNLHLPPSPNDMGLPPLPPPPEGIDVPLPPPPADVDTHLSPPPERNESIPDKNESAHEIDDEGFEWFIGHDGVNWYRPHGELVEWTKF